MGVDGVMVKFCNWYKQSQAVLWVFTWSVSQWLSATTKPNPSSKSVKAVTSMLANVDYLRWMSLAEMTSKCNEL